MDSARPNWKRAILRGVAILAFIFAIVGLIGWFLYQQELEGYGFVIEIDALFLAPGLLVAGFALYWVVLGLRCDR